ncbi:hypothetical protein ABT023_16215 [Micromonospora sp. NPDC002296]|uniref:hypothetical protein n=1 Tax=Micromonospora sp. NPDC002296 TaxID=3154271 RepID=UPI00333241E5
MWHAVGDPADRRWDWDADEDRHLMVLDNGVFAEWHIQWVHKYRAPEQINEEWPLTDAVWFETIDHGAQVDSDEEAFALLVDAVAVVP